MAERKRAAKVRRRERKSVPVGQVHIQATFNNTIITITDPTGATVAWGSGGLAGFKGSRKSTPYAAALSADGAARRAAEHGMRQVEVFVKGPGAGREQAIRSQICDAASRAVTRPVDGDGVGESPRLGAVDGGEAYVYASSQVLTAGIGADGVYTADGLPPGDVLAWATVDGLALPSITPHQARVKAEEELSETRAELEKLFVSLA